MTLTQISIRCRGTGRVLATIGLMALVGLTAAEPIILSSSDIGDDYDEMPRDLIGRKTWLGLNTGAADTLLRERASSWHTASRPWGSAKLSRLLCRATFARAASWKRSAWFTTRPTTSIIRLCPRGTGSGATSSTG